MVNPVDECRKMWYSLYIPKRWKQDTKELFRSLKNKHPKYSTHKSQIQNTKDIHFVEYFTEDKKDSFINGTVFFYVKIQVLIYALATEAVRACSVWTQRLSIYNQFFNFVLLFVIYNFT